MNGMMYDEILWVDLVVRIAGLRNLVRHPSWMDDEIDSPKYMIYGGIFILYLQNE